MTRNRTAGRQKIATNEDIFQYVKGHFVQHGFVPGVKKIADHFGYNTTSAVSRALNELHAQGRLTRETTSATSRFMLPLDDFEIEYSGRE